MQKQDLQHCTTMGKLPYNKIEHWIIKFVDHLSSHGKLHNRCCSSEVGDQTAKTPLQSPTHRSNTTQEQKSCWISDPSMQSQFEPILVDQYAIPSGKHSEILEDVEIANLEEDIDGGDIQPIGAKNDVGAKNLQPIGASCQINQCYIECTVDSIPTALFLGFIDSVIGSGIIVEESYAGRCARTNKRPLPRRVADAFSSDNTLSPGERPVHRVSGERSPWESTVFVSEERSGNPLCFQIS